jgi:ABC-2 type transport system permease protein
METAILQGVLQQTIYTKTPGLFTSLFRSDVQRRLNSPRNMEIAQRVQSVVKEFFPESRFDINRWVNDSTGQSDSTRLDSVAAARTSSFFANLIQIDRQQLVGQHLANPGLTRSIGGWAIMFVLFSLTGASRAFVEEYDTGTLHRLLTAPVTRGAVLLSKYIYNWLLGVVQLLVLFLFGAVMFSVDIYSNFGNLLLIILLSSAAATAFGMFLAAIARTAAQLQGLSTLLILTMSAVGGSWFPVSFMPSYIQTVSRFTLTYWSVDGFLNVLWRNVGFAQLLPNIAVLAFIAVGLTAISVWRFQKREAW